MVDLVRPLIDDSRLSLCGMAQARSRGPMLMYIYTCSLIIIVALYEGRLVSIDLKRLSSICAESTAFDETIQFIKSSSAIFRLH